MNTYNSILNCALLAATLMLFAFVQPVLADHNSCKCSQGEICECKNTCDCESCKCDGACNDEKKCNCKEETNSDCSCDLKGENCGCDTGACNCNSH